MNSPEVDPNWLAVQQQQTSDAGMFGLLAQLWIKEIDLATLESLASGELRERFLTAGGWLPETADPESVEKLAIEYCACFLGPKHHLPPYQSVVVHSRFQGDCVESMKSFVDLIGQLESEFAQPNMLDHAGVQFKLAQTICHEFSSVSPESLDSLIELQNSFYLNHLGWIRKYCDVAARQTTSQFYAALFHLTEALLAVTIGTPSPTAE